MLYLNNLFEPIQQLSQLYNTVQSAGAALQQALRRARHEADASPSGRARSTCPRDGAIDVDDVTFAYGERPRAARRHRSHVAAGERLALVGPTGAGKSTLAKLIARFYDPPRARSLVDGVDLRDATLQSLRERIVVVPQEGFLFAGTFRDNVRVGRPEATDAEVDDALAALGLLERFAAFPDGLDTEVRERGSRCRPASASSCRSRAPRSPTRRSSCSTKRRRTSTPAPSTRSSRRSSGSMDGRTVVVVAHRLSTAASAPIASPSSTTAASPSSARTPSSSTVGGHYAELYRAWSVHHAPKPKTSR